jgi:hypothetical protein
MNAMDAVLLVFDTNIKNDEYVIGSAYIGVETVYYFDPNESTTGKTRKNVIDFDSDQDTSFAETYVLKKITPSFVDALRSSHEKKLSPTISGFCRDKDDKYKGLGTLMLKTIKKIYDQKDIRRIFVVAESSYGVRESSADGHCGIGKHGYDNKESEYYINCKKLIGYYESVGFELLKHHYVVDKCNEAEYIMLNVLLSETSSN